MQEFVAFHSLASIIRFVIVTIFTEIKNGSITLIRSEIQTCYSLSYKPKNRETVFKISLKECSILDKTCPRHMRMHVFSLPPIQLVFNRKRVFSLAFVRYNAPSK